MSGATDPHVAPSGVRDGDGTPGNSTADNHSDSLDILEWDRFRAYLRAVTAPLAIIEVESQMQADSAFVVIREIAGDAHVHVFRAREGEDFRGPLDWLEQQTDHDGVFVIADLDAYTVDEPSRQQFWMWANAQRERWPRPDGKVVFLLQPPQVDALCRYAPMLWEWIPLKFNLIRAEHASHRAPRDSIWLKPAFHRVASSPVLIPPGTHLLRERHIEQLKFELLRARQKGLPEHIVVRDYAWPLFRALVESKEWDAARHVLELDLGYAFPTELPWMQARAAIPFLKRLFAQRGSPDRVSHALRAIRFYIYSNWRRPELRNQLQSLGYLALGAIAFAHSEPKVATAWLGLSFQIAKQIRDERGCAMVYELLADITRRQGDLASAEQLLLMAIEGFDNVGEGKDAARVLRQLASIRLQREAPATQGDSSLRQAGTTPGRSLKRTTRRVLSKGLMAVATRVEKLARVILKPERRAV